MDAKRQQVVGRAEYPPGDRAVEAEIYRTLLAGGDAEQLIGRTLSILRGRLAFDWGGLVALDPLGAQITSSWVINRGGEAELEAAPPLIEVPQLPDAAEPRQEVLPLRWGGELSVVLAARGLSRLLSVPLRSGGRDPSGIILLAARSETAFPKRSLLLMGLIAGPLATALEAAGRERELERRVDARVKEISVLHDITRALGTTLRYDDLLRLLMDSLYSLLGFDVAGILIDLPGLRDLTLSPSRPIGPDCRAWAAGALRDAFVELSGHGAPPAEPLVRPIGAFDHGAALVQGVRFSHRSAPLASRGHVVGVLAVFGREGAVFPESSARLLDTLANQASLTLDRLRTVQEAEEGRVQSIIDSMPNGVLTTDTAFRIEFMNPAARSNLELITGGAIPAVLDVLGDLKIAEIARPVLAGERQAATAEIRVSDPRRVFALGLGRMSGMNGRAAGVVLVISDVSETRLMQEQLLQAEKLSALGEMISGVAHELNNPLASVMGYSQILQGASVREDVRKKLQVIYSEAQRCQRIVQNLLSFARKHHPEKRLLDLNSVLSSILTLLAYQLRVDGIAVKSALDSQIPPIHGDFHQLQQVFLNIINNAHQAMRESGSTGELEVISSTVNDMVHVEIRDIGPGIHPENLKRVFDPFFTTKAVGQGTGLGLSLAYGTVKDHGGNIFARSRLGFGSTFVVELPIARWHERDPSEAAPPTAVEAVKKGSILVVDDERMIASLLVEALSAVGHRVDTAHDGREALSRIEAGSYDLVISDFKMPQMDGRRLFDEVSRVKPHLATRMIFSTGDLASTDTHAFIKEKNLPCISKPFDIQEVYRMVSHILGRTDP